MYVQNVKPSMSLGEALTSVFNKYATFTGRARRSEYWWFMFVYFLISTFFGFISFSLVLSVMIGEMAVNDPMYTMYLMIGVIVGLGLILPSLAVTVRRFHDIGKSGWNLLWGIIPIIGVILVFVWMCQDSNVEANKYGESPKYIKMII